MSHVSRPLIRLGGQRFQGGALSQRTSHGAWTYRYRRPDVAALYLHIPFCAQKCLYCDFASWETSANDPLMGAYARALESQLREVASLGLLSGCGTAYVGGGTPTMLGERLAQLVRTTRALAPRIGELSCEANPDSLSDALIEALRVAGATRLSIGVQSLDDGELSALGRIHDAREACDRVGAAVASGLDVSCDLMCAIPLQTDASWLRTLEGIVGCGVGHVSVYPLSIEDGTALGRRLSGRNPSWNDPDVQADCMEQACVYLEERGYVRYEVASYARPGKECRHNEAYWTGLPYLGLGTGASSMLTRDGYVRLRRCCPQLPEPPEGMARFRLSVTSDRRSIARKARLADLHFDIEMLDERQAVAEDLMLGMRLVRGVPAELRGYARDVIGAEAVDAAIERVVSQGLARHTDIGGLVPTKGGWLLGNELYGELWSLAGGPVSSCSC